MQKDSKDYAKEIAAINLILKRFLTASAEELGESLHPTSMRSLQGRSKLSNLTDHQLYELCVDVHDEFQARSPRLNNSDDKQSFIMPDYSLNSKRLQARQKLSTLTDARCRDLLYDITLEISKRGYSSNHNGANDTQQFQSTSDVSKTDSNSTSNSSRPYSPLLLPPDAMSSSSSVISDTSQTKYCSIVPLRSSHDRPIDEEPLGIVNDEREHQMEFERHGLQGDGAVEPIKVISKEEDGENKANEEEQLMVDDEINRLIQEDGLIPVQMVQNLNQYVVRSYELVNSKSFNDSDDLKIELFRTIFEISKVVSQLLEIANLPELQNEVILLKTSLSSAITSIRYFTVYGELLLPKITVHAALADISYAVCNLVGVAKLKEDGERGHQMTTTTTTTKSVKGATVQQGNITRSQLKNMVLDNPTVKGVNVRPFKLSEKFNESHTGGTNYSGSATSDTSPATSASNTSGQYYKDSPSNSPITRSLNFFRRYQHHNLSNLKAFQEPNTVEPIKETGLQPVGSPSWQNEEHEDISQSTGKQQQQQQQQQQDDNKPTFGTVSERKSDELIDRFSWEPIQREERPLNTNIQPMEIVSTPKKGPETRTSKIKMPKSAPRHFRESPIRGMQSMFRYKSMMDHHRMAVGTEKLTRDASFSEKVKKFGDGKGHGLGLVVVDDMK